MNTIPEDDIINENFITNVMQNARLALEARYLDPNIDYFSIIKELLFACKQTNDKYENQSAIVSTVQLQLEKALNERDAAIKCKQSVQPESQMPDKKAQIETSHTKGEAINNESLPDELVDRKTYILHEYDRLNSEVIELTKRLRLQRIYTDELEKKREESEKKNNELFKILDESSGDMMKKKILQEQLEKQVKEMSTEKTILVNNLEKITMDNAEFRIQNTGLRTKGDQLSEKLEQTTENLQQTWTKLTRTIERLTDRNKENSELLSNVKRTNELLNLRESEIRALTRKNNAILKQSEMLQRKIDLLNGSKASLMEETVALKNLVHTYQKEEDATKRTFEQQRKVTKMVMQERDVLQQNLQKINNILDDLQNTINSKESEIRLLTGDIKEHIQTINDEIALRKKMESERNRYASETEKNAKQLLRKQVEIEMKVEQIVELTTTLADMKSSLARLQRQYDDVCSERVLLRRNLGAITEDRDNQRERLGMAIASRDQLKEVVTTKEQELSVAKKTIDKLKIKIVTGNCQIHHLTVNTKSMASELKGKQREIDQLNNLINDDEKKFMEINKNLQALAQDKDLIGSQLVRRNDEIAGLNERLRVNQVCIDRAESEYNNRLDDIRLLKIELNNLRQHKNVLQKTIEDTVDTRTEVLHLNRELLQIQLQYKALEEEMVQPVNIHRWRKLAGTDPEQMELLNTNQVLRKSLLTKNVKLAEQDRNLSETRSLNKKLLQISQRTRTDRFKQLKIEAKRTHSLNLQIKLLKIAGAESKAQLNDVRFA